MTNARAAALIAERLPQGLQHPGDPDAQQKPFTIPLPALRHTGVPDEMAKHFANEAGFPTADANKMLGEAIVHLLETDGDFTIIPNTELAQLRRDAADAPTGARVIKVRCTCHRQDLLHLTISKADQVDLDGSVFRALAKHGEA